MGYFDITSAKGRIYTRAMLRSRVRKAFAGFPEDHIERALAMLDDSAWMRFRRGQTPSSVVHDISFALYGVR